MRVARRGSAAARSGTARARRSRSYPFPAKSDARDPITQRLGLARSPARSRARAAGATKDLDRKYQAMERDRKSYTDESQNVIRKQRCVHTSPALHTLCVLCAVCVRAGQRGSVRGEARRGAAAHNIRVLVQDHDGQAEERENRVETVNDRQQDNQAAIPEAESEICR